MKRIKVLKIFIDDFFYLNKAHGVIIDTEKFL